MKVAQGDETEAQRTADIEASRNSIDQLSIHAQTISSQVAEEQEYIALLQQQRIIGELPQKQQDRLHSLREKKANSSAAQGAGMDETKSKIPAQGQSEKASSDYWETWWGGKKSSKSHVVPMIRHGKLPEGCPRKHLDRKLQTEVNPQMPFILRKVMTTYLILRAVRAR
ncbi:hypothetical protein NW762_010870 [Fusarium torreyae]|uniref:Uncharacterized protein n=1 Tax=Fusarium torreyae TaxID=1237075 RepID=A0A9W8RUU6_9HYPO|nr:hypothetical protein NW762_010870 [Fusarium torreyae]